MGEHLCCEEKISLSPIRSVFGRRPALSSLRSLPFDRSATRVARGLFSAARETYRSWLPPRLRWETRLRRPCWPGEERLERAEGGRETKRSGAQKPFFSFYLFVFSTLFLFSVESFDSLLSTFFPPFFTPRQAMKSSERRTASKLGDAAAAGGKIGEKLTRRKMTLFGGRFFPSFFVFIKTIFRFFFLMFFNTTRRSRRSS